MNRAYTPDFALRPGRGCPRGLAGKPKVSYAG
jgi:hypothetical protein